MRSSKKWPTLKSDGYTIVVIDQHTQAVATNQKPTWFPVNSRPRPAVSDGRAAINMLGAVTDAGEHFVALTPDSFTATVSKHFLRALCHRFGTKLVIVLDNAPYFIAKDLKKQAAADGLLLEYLPSYAPEMNPLENCWLQLKAARKNRLFETIDNVKRFLTATIPELTAPAVYHYLC